jgi:phospholipase C
VGITPSSASIVDGQSATLNVTAAANATQVVVTGTDNTSYILAGNGGTLTVTPITTTTYTAVATGPGGISASESTTITVTAPPPGTVKSINHVIFMLQENRSFDSYFGMLNPYRHANGWNIGDNGQDYEVDGIDDKLAKISNVDDAGTAFSLFKFTTTCVDDMTSAWLESYGDVNRYDFLTTRPILMDGFVHTAEGYAASGSGDGSFTDLVGQRAMGYYDEGFLNYYYYMASQFAVSDRWFSPVSSKSTPNRLATMTGGTTQGLVKDPFVDDKFTSQLDIPTIFGKLDKAGVSWKIYYTVNEGGCTDPDGECSSGKASAFPVTTFADFTDSYKYLHAPQNGVCAPPTIPSGQAVGDTSNSFCIDPTHIAPLSQYFLDVQNGTLPAYAFIEAGYGINDEHPGSGQSILSGQAQVASIINKLMNSPSWASSVFFLSYDEPGGPYDHVPPVPGHSNDNTDASLGNIPDISSIAVNADTFMPCVPTGGTPTLHCDLSATDPGANSGDAPAQNGFAAQLGFRLPNMIISPFARRHYVSHTPMDHTAIIRFVEDRFIGDGKYLTGRDAVQPNLLEFFDFNNTPWATAPTPPQPQGIGSSCHPATMQ